MDLTSLFSRAAVISAGELRDLLDRSRPGELILVDVREAAEFSSGHLPGALHIPLSRLAERARDIPRGRPVVTY